MNEQQRHSCWHAGALVRKVETRAVDWHSELWKRVIVEVLLLPPVVRFQPMINDRLQTVLRYANIEHPRRIPRSLGQSDKFQLLPCEIQILLRNLQSIVSQFWNISSVGGGVHCPAASAATARKRTLFVACECVVGDAYVLRMISDQARSIASQMLRELTMR